MESIKNFSVGDTLVMKKSHACGESAKSFEVLRLGSDIRIKCVSCGHEIVVPRVKIEKSIKSIIPKNQ